MAAPPTPTHEGTTMTGTRRRGTAAILLTGLLGSALAWASPSLAAQETVNAEVVALSSTACLEVSSTAIDFGALPFGTVGALADPPITVTNCATVTGDILAIGTNATGNGGAVWGLSDFPDTYCGAHWPTAELMLGDFHLRVDTGTSHLPLNRWTHTPIVTLAAGASKSLGHRIDMPCPGSPGGGQTMSFQITYLAVTEPAP
jgi:hypothetical protein